MGDFRKLRIWQEAKNFAVEVYKITNGEHFKKDFGLRDQIQRSSVSIASNIAEGFERGSNKEFIRFLYVAKGSCGELRTQVFIAYELRYLDKKLLKEIYFVLKKGGKFISVTPNGYSYIALISKITPFWFHKWYNKLRGVDSIDVYPTYYRFNSYFKIKKVAKQLGFEVEKLLIITGHASCFSFSKILFKIVSFFHYILSKITFLNKLIGINIFVVLKK